MSWSHCLCSAFSCSRSASVSTVLICIISSRSRRAISSRGRGPLRRMVNVEFRTCPVFGGNSPVAPPEHRFELLSQKIPGGRGGFNHWTIFRRAPTRLHGQLLLIPGRLL